MEGSEREEQKFWKMVSTFTWQLSLNVHSANGALLVSNQPLIYTHLVEKVHTWKAPVIEREKKIARKLIVTTAWTFHSKLTARFIHGVFFNVSFLLAAEL